MSASGRVVMGAGVGYILSIMTYILYILTYILYILTCIQKNYVHATYEHDNNLYSIPKSLIHLNNVIKHSKHIKSKTSKKSKNPKLKKSEISKNVTFFLIFLGYLKKKVENDIRRKKTDFFEVLNFLFMCVRRVLRLNSNFFFKILFAIEEMQDFFIDSIFKKVVTCDFWWQFLTAELFKNQENLRFFVFEKKTNLESSITSNTRSWYAISLALTCYTAGAIVFTYLISISYSSTLFSFIFSWIFPLCFP